MMWNGSRSTAVNMRSGSNYYNEESSGTFNIPMNIASEYTFNDIQVPHPGDINECGDNICVSNRARECYDDLSGDEQKYYPYLRPRKGLCKSWVEINIYGSAPIAAWKEIFIICTLCVLASLLLIFEVIPATIFPIDGFAFGHVFAVFSFFIGIYYSLAIARNRVALEKYIIEIMGNTTDAAINSSSVIKDNAITANVWKYSYDVNKMEVHGKRSKAICHVTDLQFILKAIPYAIKHKYRPEEGLDPYRLPMPKDLTDELVYGIKLNMDGLDVLREMYLKRVTRLLEADVIPSAAHGNLLAKADNWGTSIGYIDFLLSSGGSMPPILFNLTSVSIWIYCIYLAFAFYPYWALQLSLWAYYIALFTIVIFLLSLFKSISTIDNPFVDPEKSNFISLDLGGIANSSAENVDAHYKKLIKELISYTTNKLDSELK